MPHSLNDVSRAPKARPETRTFTNRDLSRAPRSVFPGPDIPFPEDTDTVNILPEMPPVQDDRPAVDALLRLAKATLAGANTFSGLTGAHRIAPAEGPTIVDRADELADLPPVMPQSTGQRITGGISAASLPALGPALAFGGPIGAMAGAAASGGLLPDFARRAAIPAEGEERPGAIETALTLAPLARLRGSLSEANRLRKMGKSKFAGRSAPHMPSQGQEIPFQSSQRAQNPNKIADLVRELAAENQEPVEQVLQTGRRAIPGGSAARDAILRLIQSGRR